MNIPYLSPYLHPMKILTDDGKTELWFDHGSGMRRHFLTRDELSLVSLLWPKHAKEEILLDSSVAFQNYVKANNTMELLSVINGLFERGFLFSDPESCDSALMSTVENYLERLPLVDQIELTNNCVMHCRFCPRGIPGAITRPTGKMSVELFKVLLDQLPERQQTYHPLELDLMGESLLHPEVEKFVEATSQHNIPSELSVNPTLLTPELSKRLVQAGISRLVISLDGMNNESLAAIRGKNANYDKAAANILALFKIAEERTEPPQIVIQMIDFGRNRDQQKAFLDIWGNTGKLFVVAYIKPLDGLDPDTGKLHESSPRFLCTYPFVSISVLWDGSVVPCCRDANGKYILGNLNENSLEEIWCGSKVEQLRDAYRKDRFDQGHLCENCPWRRSTYVAARWERHPDRAVFEPMHW